MPVQIKEEPISGSESSTEYDYDDEEEEYRDIYWSCKIDEFEAKVLQAVGHDLTLAANLIPHLHTMLRQEGSWSINTTQCMDGPGEQVNGTSSSYNFSGAASGGGSWRPGRQSGSDEDLGEQQENNSEGNDERDPKRTKGSSSGDSKNKKTHLACPFNKWNPSKYNLYHNSGEGGIPGYRSCHGPGFASIPRLK